MITSEEGAGSSPRGTILFVDDERRVLTSMRAMFRRDYSVLLANSGQEALDLLHDHDVDVIISDQRMPGMTGVEVLRQVKALAPRAMRILLTGYADLKAIEASINEGEVFRYLTKPCPTEVLKEAIALAVEAAHDGEVRTEHTPAPAAAAPRAPIVHAPAIRTASQPLLNDDYELIEVVPAGARTKQAPAEPAKAPPAREKAPVAAREIPAAVTERTARPDDAAPTAMPSAANVAAAVSATPTERPPRPAAAPRLKPVPRRPPRTEIRDVDLLVLTADATMVGMLETALAGSHCLHTAHTVEAAVAVLESHPVGVLVTDMAVRQDDIEQLTTELKRHVPELVTIVASDRSDAQRLIDLINFGQIFRFLLKPLHPGQCRLSIEAAVGRHREISLDPRLARRHAVAARPQRAVPQGVVHQVLDRVRRLRERLLAAGGVA